MTERIEPGKLTTLAPGVRRLTAPNPSLMTGPGTNTYLIGDAEIAVIDPGPAIDSHIQQIVEVGDGRIRWILATHTHPDHSPAIAPLAVETGAMTGGIAAPDGAHQDKTFRPTLGLADGNRINLVDSELLVVHTPGHASNHLCFLHTSLNWLFTGDHIINGSTVVIDPPDGDMSAYLTSLNRLAEMRIERIAPGHGDVIEEPHKAIAALIAHRLKREAKVFDALAGLAGATLEELVKVAYDDVDAALHRLAQRSLLAHLLKLESDGRARRDEVRWSLA